MQVAGRLITACFRGEGVVVGRWRAYDVTRPVAMLVCCVLLSVANYASRQMDTLKSYLHLERSTFCTFI